MKKKIHDILYSRKISYNDLGKELGLSPKYITQIVHKNFPEAKKFNQALGKSSSVKLNVFCCRKCDKVLKLNARNGKRGNVCYECSKKEVVRLQQKRIDKQKALRTYYLYYLPEHHYIGITNNPKRRISQHQYTQGRIVEGWEIIAEYKNPKLAAFHEAMMHLIGYNGSAYDGIIKHHDNGKMV